METIKNLDKCVCYNSTAHTHTSGPLLTRVSLKECFLVIFIFKIIII